MAVLKVRQRRRLCFAGIGADRQQSQHCWRRAGLGAIIARPPSAEPHEIQFDARLPWRDAHDVLTRTAGPDCARRPPQSRSARRCQSPTRIQAALTLWRSRLLDLTKRNRGLNFKPNKVSTVTIVDEQPAEVFRHLRLDGRPMRFNPTLPSAARSSWVRDGDTELALAPRTPSLQMTIEAIGVVQGENDGLSGADDADVPQPMELDFAQAILARLGRACGLVWLAVLK